MRKPAPVPCHLIAGTLGVGKTTAIRRFVADSPDYVAVIVNDYGKTGYDASFIAEQGGPNKLRVENVPGGCLCCTSAAQLLPVLKMICARPEVQRIIVEPSGVALLDPLLKMLHAAAPEYGFELAPVIVLFDAAKTRPAVIDLIPYWQHLVERADIAVINRCDLAAPQAVEQLFQCLENRHPPKMKIIKTVHGELPQELFSLRGAAARPADGHFHKELPPAGMFCSEKIFRRDALLEQLEQLAPQLDRFKGIFQTDQGWLRMEIAAGSVSCCPTAAAAQTSAEWIGRGSEVVDQLKGAQIRL